MVGPELGARTDELQHLQPPRPRDLGVGRALDIGHRPAQDREVVLRPGSVDRGTQPELTEHVAFDADEVQHEVAHRGAAIDLRLPRPLLRGERVEQAAELGGGRDECVVRAQFRSRGGPTGLHGRPLREGRVDDASRHALRQRLTFRLDHIQGDLDKGGLCQVHAGESSSFKTGRRTSPRVASASRNRDLAVPSGMAELGGDLSVGATAVVGEDDGVALLRWEPVERVTHVARDPRSGQVGVDLGGRCSHGLHRPEAGLALGAARLPTRTRSTLRLWASRPSQVRMLPRAGSNRPGCSQR